MTLHFALIGEDLFRSPSKVIHEFVFKRLGLDADYELLPVRREEADVMIPQLMSQLDGLNVTSPYKEEVARLLSSRGCLSDEARKAFSVNTIWGGRGYSTDYVAVKKILRRLADTLGETCLLIGAGGAARAASLALGELGLKVYVLNRSQQRALSLVNDMRALGFDFFPWNGVRADLVVNAVPPEPKLDFTPMAYVDFSYLRRANRGSHVNVGGDEILVVQALEADAIWFGDEVREVSEQEVLEVARQFIWRRN
ncbi:MAG: shikimate dehydrogenase family protein [Thermoprotei archaeon]